MVEVIIGDGGLLAPLPKLHREQMPTDFSISIAGCGGADRILYGPRRDRRQALPGFEDTYEDIVDYIIRITYRIWEDNDVAYIEQTYHPLGRVTGGAGLKTSRQEIIDESAHHLKAFPDIRLLADGVIWAGNEEVGYRTSHRLWESAHHTGPAEFGEPSGRRSATWALANCVVVENQIVEEWVLDNTAALFASLGMDYLEQARSAADSSDLGPLVVLHGDIERKAAEYVAPTEDSVARDVGDPGAMLRLRFHQLWNDGDLTVVEGLFADNVRYHGATGRELHGRAEIADEVAGFRAMFPDLLRMTDEVYWQGNEEDGFLVSLRWSAVGTHTGDGPYGQPTGRRVSMWGITQVELRWGRILEEWTLFNEFELLQQILRSEPLS